MTIMLGTYNLKCQPAYRRKDDKMTVQMSNETRTSEVSIAKTMQIMMGQQQRNMTLQAPVQRPSPGDHAAYLPTEMPTTISSDNPHDNRHDEQKRMHVRDQYREKNQNHDG